MFQNNTDRLTATVVVFLLFLIPLATFLLAKRMSINEQLVAPSQIQSEETTPKPDLQSSLQENLTTINNKLAESTLSASILGASTDPDTQVSYGPSLTLKAILEGETASQPTRLFIGISPGQTEDTPTYVVSFVTTLKPDGTLTNIPISGLTEGETYTAYIKTPTQIATAVTFVMKSTVNDLGLVDLLSGDLNNDNQINNIDYSLAQKAFGANSNSPNWNPNADFNGDGVVTSGDLAMITRNLGKKGAAGVWHSSPLDDTDTVGPNFGGEASNSATPSAQPNGKLPSGQDGYWLWVPHM